MRAISRAEGVSLNTVAKLLNDAGAAAQAFLNEHVRQIPHRRRIECSQTWAFSYQPPWQPEDAVPHAENTWTFAAIDVDTKLIVSCLVGDDSRRTMGAFLEDVQRRLRETPELSTDGLRRNDDGDGRLAARPSVDAPPKPDGSMPQMPSNPEKRRLEKHVAMVSLFALHYNYCRIHPALAATPAMAAGLDGEVRDMSWLVDLIDARAKKPNRPKTYRKRGDRSKMP